MSHWWETPLSITVIDKVQFNHECFSTYKKDKVQLVENSAKKIAAQLGLRDSEFGKENNLCYKVGVYEGKV